MAKINKPFNVGYLVESDTCGVAVAGDKDVFGPDSIDARVSIAPCGEGVFEIWFHTAEPASIRIIVDRAWMKDVAKAMKRMAKAFPAPEF